MAAMEEAERVAAEACVRQDDESKCTSRTDCTWKKPGKCTKKSRTPHEMSVDGGADMAIAARYYGLPSLQARGRKRAGITRDQSWAWADIYDGGGGIS